MASKHWDNFEISSAASLLTGLIFGLLIACCKLPPQDSLDMFELIVGTSFMAMVASWVSTLVVVCIASVQMSAARSKKAKDKPACPTLTGPTATKHSSNAPTSSGPKATKLPSPASAPTTAIPTASAPTTSVPTTPASTMSTPTTPMSTKPSSPRATSVASHRLDFRNYTTIDSDVCPEGTRLSVRRYHQPGSSSSTDIGLHFSYPDGSYKYEHPDESVYSNNGKGFSRYTRANGSGWTKQQFAAPGNETGVLDSARIDRALTTLGMTGALADSAASQANEVASLNNEIANLRDDIAILRNNIANSIVNIAVLTDAPGSTPRVLTPPSTPGESHVTDAGMMSDEEGFELLWYAESATSHAT